MCLTALPPQIYLVYSSNNRKLGMNGRMKSFLGPFKVFCMYNIRSFVHIYGLYITRGCSKYQKLPLTDNSVKISTKNYPLVGKSYNIGSNCQEMIYTVTQLRVPTHLTQIYAIESIDPIM